MLRGYAPSYSRQGSTGELIFDAQGLSFFLRNRQCRSQAQANVYSAGYIALCLEEKGTALKPGRKSPSQQGIGAVTAYAHYGEHAAEEQNLASRAASGRVNKLGQKCQKE